MSLNEPGRKPHGHHLSMYMLTLGTRVFAGLALLSSALQTTTTSENFRGLYYSIIPFESGTIFDDFPSRARRK